MGQPRPRAGIQTRLSNPVSIVVRTVRRGRVALSLAGAVSLLAGSLLALAPAASAASSTFAVTEVPIGLGFANSVAVDPATNTVYAGIDNGHAVAVIDGTSNAESALINLPNSPSTVAVDPATNTVYAICGTAAGVDVIDGATNTLTAKISLPSTLETFAAAVNPVTDMLYITDYFHGTVIVINGSTDTVAATVSLTDPVLDPLPRPHAIAVDTATNTIYVGDLQGNQVEVIDGTTNQVTSRIALPASSDPYGAVADPAAGLVYLADQGTGSISVIDTATDGVSTLASGVVEPEGLALDAGTGTLYATSPIGAVNDLPTTYVIDTASGVIDAQIPRGGTSAAVLKTGGPVYVDGAGPLGGLDDDVTVITPSTVNTMSPVVLGDLFIFTVGKAGLYQLIGSGTPQPSLSATGMPDWLSMSPSGSLSGTPPAGSGGNYDVVITAANGVAPADTTTVGVTVDEAPTITSAAQLTSQQGVAVSFTMAATGWPGAEFSESGALPDGLALYSSGLLSGTPAADTAGVYPITVTASNSVGSATQQFTLTVGQQQQQAYEVQASQQSGFCLDNSGGSSHDGNPIQVWSCLGNANQGWTYVPSVNGVANDFQLENSNGMCLDDPGDSAVNGTRVQLWSCLGNPNQQWTAVTVDGSFTEYVNANGLCLDNAGNAAADGSRVQVWACNGDAAQHWYGPSPQSSTIPPAYPVQASQQSGFCLDNTGGNSRDGNPIHVWSCLGNANQGWKYVPSVNGVAGDFQLENSNGRCLDDPRDSAVNGTKVQLWSCLGNPNQTWTQATAGSYVEYVNANGLCLDNTGNSLTDGNRVQVWACLGDPAQQWYGPSSQSGVASP